jgi:iron complex transport system substrate-binding protein
VLHYPNGFTSGEGSLAHAILEAAGLANLAAEAGVRGMARLSLETLMLAAPELIVTGEGYGAPALADEVLHHPATRALAGSRRVELPAALTTCGTPFVVEAIERLRAAAGLERRVPAP